MVSIAGRSRISPKATASPIESCAASLTPPAKAKTVMPAASAYRPTAMRLLAECGEKRNCLRPLVRRHCAGAYGLGLRVGLTLHSRAPQGTSEPSCSAAEQSQRLTAHIAGTMDYPCTAHPGTRTHGVSSCPVRWSGRGITGASLRKRSDLLVWR